MIGATPTYEHRQTAQWLILITAVPAVLMAMGAFMTGAVGLFVPAVLLLVLGVNFAMLVTRVDANGVSWAYTFGWPGLTIAFADIDRVEMTKTNFWEGWGIHWTIWHGWLWNVSGYGAVMIHRRGAGAITVGTDDPHGLYDAIERARAKP